MTHVSMPEHAAISTERSDAVDAIVVGAGFAGLYALYRLRQLGLTTRVVEAGKDVGGTWYWNRYPGARCDATSLLYSFSFSSELEEEWTWSEKYATQPEILAYLGYVADKFDLRRDIWFETRIASAEYSEADNLWHVRSESGDHVTARYCIMATGCLSVGRIPDIPGLDETELAIYHTGSWPHEGVDFAGKHVGVIGTGSSGIQLIPEIARQAAELVVFQRTPNFSVPAMNQSLAPAQLDEFRKSRSEVRALWREGQILGAGEEIRPGSAFARPISALEVSEKERAEEYNYRWKSGGAWFVGAFGDLLTDLHANETAAAFVRDRIRETVEDPDVAAKLTPVDHPIGAKRICVDSNYFNTFNRPNVELVDLNAAPITRISKQGVVTASGEHKLDALVFATGFDAMTGALSKMDIRGRKGLTLAHKWAAGPRTYLGLMVSDFPNLFLITGPGSPSVLGNVVCHIEQHVDYVADLIADSRRINCEIIDADAVAEERWVKTVNDAAASTLMSKANSWYLGANVPGKPRIFMPFVGGIGAYRLICDQAKQENYEGFVRTGAGSLPHVAAQLSATAN